jgi:hypothetical protein
MNDPRMGLSGNASRSICYRCGLSLVPLNVPHVARQCERCGQLTHLVEPGEHGQGIQIRAGDRFTIPASWLTISLDQAQSRGILARAGLPWFVKTLYFSGLSTDMACLEPLMEQYENQADGVLKRNSLLGELDIEKQEDADAIITILQAHKDSPEWWSIITGFAISAMKDAIASGDARMAAWAGVLCANARAMLIFHEALEETVWRGYSLQGLRRLLQTWEANRLNSDEEFWQKLMADHAVILSQVFSYPVVILKDKAFVGGKGIENSGGNVADFLLANELSENAVLVELKTPAAKLLGRRYRDGVYAISTELGGAISQALNYKDSMLKDYHSLKSGSAAAFDAIDPQCLVIVGDTAAELTDQARKRSFELFRRALKDVQVVTYDELFKKVEVLANLLFGVSAPLA